MHRDIVLIEADGSGAERVHAHVVRSPGLESIGVGRHSHVIGIAREVPIDNECAAGHNDIVGADVKVAVDIVRAGRESVGIAADSPGRSVNIVDAEVGIVIGRNVSDRRRNRGLGDLGIRSDVLCVAVHGVSGAILEYEVAIDVVTVDSHRGFGMQRVPDPDCNVVEVYIDARVRVNAALDGKVIAVQRVAIVQSEETSLAHPPLPATDGRREGQRPGNDNGRRDSDCRREKQRCRARRADFDEIRGGPPLSRRVGVAVRCGGDNRVADNCVSSRRRARTGGLDSALISIGQVTQRRCVLSRLGRGHVPGGGQCSRVGRVLHVGLDLGQMAEIDRQSHCAQQGDQRQADHWQYGAARPPAQGGPFRSGYRSARRPSAEPSWRAMHSWALLPCALAQLRPIAQQRAD